MSVEQGVPGIYRVNLSIVNAYLLDNGEDLTLIDLMPRWFAVESLCARLIPPRA